jgi:hypothetical protein
MHLLSAFATTARLGLAAEAVPDKASELAAIPPLLARLGAEDGLKGAIVSIDPIATNAEVARAIAGQGADWLLAVKANEPGLRAEVEAAFGAAPAGTLDTHVDLGKGHGRIEQRRTAVLRDTDRLGGARRFPAEPRLPGAACLVRAETRVERRARGSRGRSAPSPPPATPAGPSRSPEPRSAPRTPRASPHPRRVRPCQTLRTGGRNVGQPAQSLKGQTPWARRLAYSLAVALSRANGIKSG